MVLLSACMTVCGAKYPLPACHDSDATVHWGKTVSWASETAYHQDKATDGTGQGPPGTCTKPGSLEGQLRGDSDLSHGVIH